MFRLIIFCTVRVYNKTLVDYAQEEAIGESRQVWALFVVSRKLKNNND